MYIKKKLIEEENKTLDNKLKLIKDKIIKNNEIIKDYSLQDINVYKKIDESQHLKIIKEQKNLEGSIENLYFARMDIKFKDENKDETIYIGKRGVKINDDTIVVSWASPIANVYEQYNSGAYDYKHTDKNTGKEIRLQGNIKGKRKITINKGKVTDVYSYSNITEKNNEEFIKNKIDSSKTEKLEVIIETVQRDQNKIIRLPIEKNIIVQGCAGSGKSSVAFHRLAYLAHNYNLKDSELLVISPNKIFQGYTSNILMELGTDFNVNQYTFKEFTELILKRKIENTDTNYDEAKRKQAILKTSKKFKLILDNYVKHLEENFIPKDDFKIDDFELINSNNINSIWQNQFGTYKINDRIEKFKLYLQEYLRKRLEEYLKIVKKRYESNMQILRKYNKSPVMHNEMLKLTKQEQEIRIKRVEKQCIAIINGYINSFEKIDVIKKYKELMKDENLLTKMSVFIINKTKIDDITSNTVENLIDDIDCIPIMYLYYRVNENKNKYRHIVIDECQDLSYLEISVMEGLTQSFTLVGDFNQIVNVNRCTMSLDEVNDMFKKYTFFEKYCLNKSFRNPKSITNYANAILKDYFISKESIPIAFNRETKKPDVYLNVGKEQIIKAIVKNINEKKDVESKNIAVILKTEKLAMEYHSKLSNLIKNKSVNLIDNEYCKYEKGINILSAKLSKGLEFDYVILADADEYENNEDDRRLLYVATTRALHELEIYTKNKNCFITTIDKTLWEPKFNKVCANVMNEGLKSMIIKTLSDSFGELPEEYINYIESIDNFTQLSEFANKLEGIEDIDKLFEDEGVIKRAFIESQKSLSEASATLERKSNFSYLEKFLRDIKKNRHKTILTGKQLDVYEYIINNINDIPNFKNGRELSKKLGVSALVITTTLIKLNSGSFMEIVDKINECIKKDSENNL